MHIKTIISLLFILTGLISAPAQSAKSIGYWYDTSNDIVHTGSGECWRTTQWSSDNALAECESSTSNKATTEKDSDNDGVTDAKDQCPGTASGLAVDANGCATDSDKDGVIDAKDQCPRTAAGITVDSKGCEKDSDKDGITDSKDECPNTEQGVVVNTKGCKLQQSITLDNVQFKTGTAVLSTSSKAILDKVAVTLNDNKHLNFKVAGHTDNTGNYQYNVNLSKSRAQSVREYLVGRGVAADRLTAQGYGPDKPVASNDTGEGRKQNRRVELMLK